MTAPMPMRFYNPVKELCQKVNLDYETVIGTGITNKTIRDAFICSEIAKPIDEIKSEDKKFIKHKKEFFDKKYGGNGRNSTEGTGNGETEDKGRIRYDMGVNVEHLCSDDGEVDKSSSSSDGSETGKPTEKGAFSVPLRTTAAKWVPGRPM